MKFTLKNEHLWLLAVLPISLLVGYITYLHDIYYLFLFWNLFLAFVPFFLALQIFKLFQKNPCLDLKKGLLAFLWLIFFPNAPYVLTDFAHIRWHQQWSFGQSEFQFVLDFILVGVFALSSLIFGLLSLHFITEIVRKKWNNGARYYFLIVVSFLSGMAVYVGRFLRWNSWDIFLNPIRLFQHFLVFLQPKSLPYFLGFSFFFAVIILGNYFVLNRFFEYRPPNE